MEMLKKVVKHIEDVKVKDVRIYQTKSTNPLFDYVVVATANSPRQMNAVVDHIKKGSVEDNFHIKGVEGLRGGIWLLVDIEEGILVNVFMQEERENYALDQLWQDLPQIKL